MATAMTTPPTSNGAPQPAAPSSPAVVVPLYDLALDVPHPAASSNCPPPQTFAPPPGDDADPSRAEITRELSDIGRVQRFSFPEYDERVEAAHSSRPRGGGGGGGAGLNRHDVYLQNFRPQIFIFALQLKCGSRVHGHVRRYLPHHRHAQSRGDVGRRGERALVVLTRIGGADRFFDGVLKTCAALCMEKSALSESASLRRLLVSSSGGGTGDDGVDMLLRSLYLDYGKRVVSGKSRDGGGGVQGVTLHGVEFGPRYGQMAPFDTTKFHFATSLLSSSSSQVAGLTAECTSPLLPLLRRLGPSHTLRLLSALLCERRIILLSKSPTRLSSCASGAMSMLSQGDLKWQHVYVPVVPPHLIHHLAAPVPYVVGLLSRFKSELGKIPGGLGEVVTVDLDEGGAMQVYGTREPNSHIPDLLRASIVDDGYHDMQAAQYGQQQSGGGYPGGLQTNGDGTSVSPYASLPECLGGDLADVIKSDRASLVSGNRAEAVLGAAAVKATGVVKAASKFLGKKKKGGSSSSYNRQQSVESADSLESEDFDNAWDSRREQFPELLEAACVDSDEYAANARAEEEVRVAFLSFFVALLGDPATFLSRPDPSRPLVLDREKFVRERRRRGDYEGTPLYSVLTLFVNSQMFEQFGKARLLEVASGGPNQQQPRYPAANAAQQQAQNPLAAAASAGSGSGSLFALVSETVRRQNLEFNPLNVRRVARHVAARSPSEKLVQRSERVRGRALALTSKQGYENQPGGVGVAGGTGNATRDLAALTEECRDATGPMLDALGVAWTRIRDSRGMNSKHALLALIVLRNLVLHGPLAAVAEVVDAVELIRLLKSYSNKLSGATAGQIRGAAGQLYELLVDRTKLFVQRRTCAARRREVHLGAELRPRLARDRRVKFRPLKFGQVHELFRPAGAALAAAAAPSQDLLGFSADETAPAAAAAAAARPNQVGTAAPTSTAGLQDLLGFAAPPVQPPQQQGQPQPQIQQQQQQAANGSGGGGNTFDMLDLFNASVDASAAAGSTSAAAAAAPPFDPFQSNPGTPTRPAAAAAPPVNQHPQQQQGQQVMYSHSSSFGSSGAHSGPGPQQQHNQAAAVAAPASTRGRGEHANQPSPSHSTTSSSSSKEHQQQQQNQQKAASTSTVAMQAPQPNWQQHHQQKSAQATTANWQQQPQQPMAHHPYPQQQPVQQQYAQNQNRSPHHGGQHHPAQQQTQRQQQQQQQQQPMGGGSPYRGQGMMAGGQQQQPMPMSTGYPHQGIATGKQQQHVATAQQLQAVQQQQPRQLMKTTHAHTEVSVEVQLAGTMQHQHQLHPRGPQVGPRPGQHPAVMMGQPQQLRQQPGGVPASVGQQQQQQVHGHHAAAAQQGHPTAFHQQGGIAAQQPSAASGVRPQPNPPPRASIDSFDPMARR